jgi:hypothetical protein
MWCQEHGRREKSDPQCSCAMPRTAASKVATWLRTITAKCAGATRRPSGDVRLLRQSADDRCGQLLGEAPVAFVVHVEVVSAYTTTLLKHLPTPGLDIEMALRRVRDAC